MRDTTIGSAGNNAGPGVKAEGGMKTVAVDNWPSWALTASNELS